MNVEKFYQDLLNYQFVQGELEEVDDVVLIAA
jgi:hypothetical protein